jgi:YcaO-like protein with predicted kinase domain
MVLKHYRRGTHRIQEPAMMLARIAPVCPAMGITRVANLTGLDVVGIPVIGVVRPNSRSNAVLQGKGIDLEAARVSGLMEAIETFCAEQILAPLRWASVAELNRAELNGTAPMVDVTGLPRQPGSSLADSRRILWIEGCNLVGKGAVWVPFEIVHADFSVPAPAGSGQFVVSTNGLASGGHPAEAIGHGLCELIERNATAQFAADSRTREERRIDLGSIDDEDCGALIHKFTQAGVAVAVWDITSAIGIAAFECQVMERDNGPGLLPLPAIGHGCHPERGIALTRALTEAAQARVTAISGARDDIGPQYYTQGGNQSELDAWRKRLTSSEWGRSFGDVPSWSFETLEDDVDLILGRLRDVGIDQVVSVDLSPGKDGITVVRMVVPGLKGLLPIGGTPGPRAQWYGGGQE